jgi:hypothetical protein
MRLILQTLIHFGLGGQFSTPADIRIPQAVNNRPRERISITRMFLEGWEAPDAPPSSGHSYLQ